LTGEIETIEIKDIKKVTPEILKQVRDSSVWNLPGKTYPILV